MGQVVKRLEDVKREIIPFITEKPIDYRYRSSGDGTKCLYVMDDEGSCLLGKYLLSLGVPVEYFNQTVPESNFTYNEKAISFLKHYCSLDDYVVFDTSATNALKVLQICQDNGFTWRRAYQKAFNIELDED